MRRILILLALVPGIALAQSPSGVALRWNHCFGEGTGLWNRTFACDTNAGFEELVGSFTLGDNFGEVSGTEIVVDFTTAFPFIDMPSPPPAIPVPAWWTFKNAGSCRLNSLSISTLANVEDLRCPDWAGGSGVSALGAYRLDSATPYRARLIAAVAVAQTNLQLLVQAQEYYSFTLRIDHKKTVGDAGCGGCGVPVLVSFNSVRVTTPVPGNDRFVAGPLNGVDADFVTWLPEVVPTRATTWAALKSRYH
jgi:hypothetical protein